MSIVLLLIGAFFCGLFLLSLDMWIALHMNPESREEKIGDLDILHLLGSIMGLGLTSAYLVNNYDVVISQPVWVLYVTGFFAVAFLLGPVLFSVGIIVDTISKNLKKSQH